MTLNEGEGLALECRTAGALPLIHIQCEGFTKPFIYN